MTLPHHSTMCPINYIVAILCNKQTISIRHRPIHPISLRNMRKHISMVRCIYVTPSSRKTLTSSRPLENPMTQMTSSMPSAPSICLQIPLAWRNLVIYLSGLYMFSSHSSQNTFVAIHHHFLLITLRIFLQCIIRLVGHSVQWMLTQNSASRSDSRFLYENFRRSCKCRDTPLPQVFPYARNIMLDTQ